MQVTQPADLTARIKTRLLQNRNASQTEFTKDFVSDANTGREKEDIYKTAEPPVSVSRDNSISAFFHHRSVEIKI